VTAHAIFPSKGVNETVVLAFDFGPQLAADTISSVGVTTAAVYSGVDGSPSAIVSGVATFSGTVLSQKISGGIAGVIYELTAAVNTTAGQVLNMVGYLPVLPAIQ
jgi:hypothetical protein